MNEIVINDETTFTTSEVASIQNRRYRQWSTENPEFVINAKSKKLTFNSIKVNENLILAIPSKMGLYNPTQIVN